MATTDLLPPVSYTDVELASYLPAGWVLAEEPAPAWDEAKGAFRCTVIDGSDLDWELVVTKADAQPAALQELHLKRLPGFSAVPPAAHSGH